MAYKLIATMDKPVDQKRTFLCDYRTDIASLPKSNPQTPTFEGFVAIGSDALVAEDWSVWILTNSDTWKEIE